MIKTNGIPTKEQPYLTEAVNQEGKKIIINSSRKPSEYMAPGQMLEVALAGCMTMTCKGVLFSHGLAYDDVHVTIEFNYQQDHTDVKANVEIVGDIDEETKQAIIQETWSKCYVTNVLTHPINIQK